MNTLLQNENGILGSEVAQRELAGAERASVLVLSDTHGHYEVFESIVREFGPRSDALLFAGDGMWDIVQYVENARSSDRLAACLPPVVAFVAGNGDGDQYRVSLSPAEEGSSYDEAPGYTIGVPARQILRAAGYGILLVHGHHHSVDFSLDVLVDSAHAMDCDVVVYGHTHVPLAEEFSHILALNPGSPARPRGHSSPGFAVLELDAASTVPSVLFFTVREHARGGFRIESVSRAR
ncbi:MAG TPA: YfcE family phosphodiesterase [Treponemataceae bacterium]|nr:YfcE family phosphodiesterase [Treponemataceae bacterium]